VIKWEREIINETEKERENEHDMDYAYLTTVGVHRLDMQERLCFSRYQNLIVYQPTEQERERGRDRGINRGRDRRRERGREGEIEVQREVERKTFVDRSSPKE
jgi:hypothetical protein